MEPFKPKYYRTTFEKISPNLASVIAQYLTLKELFVLSVVSSKIRTLFYESEISWKTIIENFKLPNSIKSKINCVEEFKALWKYKMIKLGENRGYYRLEQDEGWFVFSAADLKYKIRGYGRFQEKYTESWFPDKELPCPGGKVSFKMEGDHVIPKGKYSVNLRIRAAGYHGYNGQSREEVDIEECLKHNDFVCVFSVEDTDYDLWVNFKKLPYMWDIFENVEVGILDTSDLDTSDFPEEEVIVNMRFEADVDGFYDFGLDAIVFIPI